VGTPEEHTIARIKRQIHRAALLVIDDWSLAPLTTTERYDLLEVLEDRAERASTLITSQLAVKTWHDVIGEPTLADAIGDRLTHTAHVIELHGPSLGGGPSQRAAQKLRREPREVADVSRRHAGRHRTYVRRSATPVTGDRHIWLRSGDLARVAIPVPSRRR
jgi:hypothetical protein